MTPHAELKSVGRARFPGSTKTKNFLWFHYRNYLRQAISNFQLALTVLNRSSSLLYYYAMLNFAKAPSAANSTIRARCANPAGADDARVSATK
jgi:hypothetical protein